MSTNLFTDVVESLRRCATVRVVVDGKPNEFENVISISRIKLNDLINAYPLIYELANKCWSNFPDPPCDERTYVFMWALACDNYCFNHGTISWERSTPNTFVHMWSIIDRMRLVLVRHGLGWVMVGRNCADFCRSTGMVGPLDANMYVPELVVPSEIVKIDDDFVPLTFKNEISEFCSYHDFKASVRTAGPERVISVSDIAMANEESIRRSGSRT
jgi:hypothetical protein